VVERAITAYHQDEVPEWVAELACGHNQHVRHRPPFQLRAWVTEETGRTAKLGMPLECPLCDRAEMPEGLRFVRSSPVWTEQTVPRGLLRAHRLGPGTWGRIVVDAGQLRFIMSTEPALDTVLGPGSSQAMPPEVDHKVRLLGPVRFTIDYLAIERRGTSGPPLSSQPLLQCPDTSDEGGDPACWAGLLCPDCGVVLDGSAHPRNCPTVT
jgi:tellurite methyltransferase